jgi:hypothetical protein
MLANGDMAKNLTIVARKARDFGAPHLSLSLVLMRSTAREPRALQRERQTWVRHAS